MDPPLGTGAPSSGNQITSKASMTIDGLPADIQFAGVAPGFVGLNQINVVVPRLARTNGADPVVLTINGVPANPVTLPLVRNKYSRCEPHSLLIYCSSLRRR